jgi:Crp-like helix-turn-helix domain
MGGTNILRIQSTSFLMSASGTAALGGIGTGPQTPSRVLHDLAASGLIEMNGRSVRIPDLERLRRGG